MAKKAGLGTLLTGIALGAAALFLSKKENREKTKRVAKKVVAKAQKLKSAYKQNPTKVKQQLKAKGKKLAKKAVVVAKKKVKKLAR